ncbi:MAG: hypothetical protein JWQ97_291 [Phenylobacterium sp.]|nr:hypothetical protein [Phenylobacterium sp.]
MAGLLDLVTFSPKRSIGSFSTYVAIEEQHTDELTITQHPVEKGPEVSDHAFKNPSQLVIHAGWSNSSLAALTQGISDLLSGDVGSLLRPSYAKDVYDQLLSLQATREPFDVHTGKRSYTSMLMRSIAVTTNAETENVLVVTATFQQVIIVQTQVTAVPAANVQANPAKTAAPVNAGTKQPQAAALSPGG